MRKDSTLQVRMDSEMKEQVEKLYASLGTSFAEAVRLFAKQSLLKGGLPFIVVTPPAREDSAFGSLSAYARPELQPREKEAYTEALKEKYHEAH